MIGSFAFPPLSKCRMTLIQLRMDEWFLLKRFLTSRSIGKTILFVMPLLTNRRCVAMVCRRFAPHTVGNSSWQMDEHHQCQQRVEGE